MEFFHAADVHLGALPDAGSPWCEKRSRELWDSFRKLIDQVRCERPQLLLLAGDLFHRQPLIRELKEVDYLFSQIPDTAVVLIAGNHDHIRADSPYVRYPWSANVTGLWQEELQSVYLPSADTRVYGMSYHSRELPVEKLLQAAPQPERGCHILLAHGGDERHLPFTEAQLGALAFDYIALGHIHRPQMLAGGKAAFCGALEPLDRSETGPHGYIRGSYVGGRLQTEFIASACRSYRNLSLIVSPHQSQLELEEQASVVMEQQGREHIYRIALKGYRDPALCFQTDRFRELGNVVEVTDDTSPDYDLSELEQRYEGSLIGAYIRRLKDSADPGEQKALYYGLEALLAAKKDG